MTPILRHNCATLATGKYPQVWCERCRRRLFDGFMLGVIVCKCGWRNYFDEKTLAKTIERAYNAAQM